MTARGPARRGPSPTRRPPGTDRCDRRRGQRAGRRPPWGRGARTTSTCSTPEGPPACPRGSCGARTTCSPGSTAPGFRRYPEDGGPDGVRAELAAQRAGHDPAAGLPADARHRRVHRARVPERGGPGGHPHLPPVRPRRAARHRRAREGQRADHRGRRLRQADPGRPRRPSGPVGPDQPGGDHLLGRDVERGDQAGPPPPPPGHAAGRRLLLVGGHRHGQLGVVRRLGRPDGPVHPRARGPGDRRRRPRRRARLGQVRGAGPGRAHPPRLLQGRGQDRRHLPHLSTGSATRCPGDYAEVGRTAPSTCSGRGSVCINTGGEKVYPEEVEEVVKTLAGVRDAVVVGIPNERFGEEIVAVVELGTPGTRTIGPPRSGHRAREGQAGRVQGAAPGAVRGHHRPVAGRQGRLRPATGAEAAESAERAAESAGPPSACRGRLGRGDRRAVSPCWRRGCARSR